MRRPYLWCSQDYLRNSQNMQHIAVRLHCFTDVEGKSFLENTMHFDMAHKALSWN